MAKTSPTQFVAEVRQEAAKVVWPTRKETALTTVMVIILSTVAAIFFFLVDSILNYGIQTVLQSG